MPTQNFLPYLFLAAQKVQPLLFFPYSFFFVLISFFFPCSHTAAPYLLFDFLKATRRLKNSLPLIPTSPTPKERKALNTSLPLTPTGPAARNKSFFQIFSSSCSQLEAIVILALSLQESMSRIRGKSNHFNLLFILNLSDGCMNLYMYVLDFRHYWLAEYEESHCLCLHVLLDDRLR